MPFPASLTLVTVSIQADEPPSGGSDGVFEFDCPYTLLGDTIVPPFTRAVALDSNGAATIQLPATNDPQWSPSGWAYNVTARVNGATITGTLTLPYTTPTATLAARLQVDGAAASGVSYILTSQRSVANGVAGLDADGDVIDANGNKVTGGGGGGGGTPSSTVVSETSYGQSASAGNATAYSRGNHTHGTPTAPAAATITDSTSVGRAVLTAADAAAARAAISAASTAHASTHASAGSDPVSIDGSQVTAGTVAIGRLPTGTSSSTVALGDAPTAAVTTHVAASDPHTQYPKIFYWNGSAYAVVTTGEIYVGPGDPGSVGDGSVWIDTDA